MPIKNSEKRRASRRAYVERNRERLRVEQRERRRRYQGTCSECGGPTDGSNGYKAPTICASCSVQRQHETRKWTPETILAALRDYHERTGIVLPADYLTRRVDRYLPPWHTVQREFPGLSFGEVRVLAGLPRRVYGGVPYEGGPRGPRKPYACPGCGSETGSHDRPFCDACRAKPSGECASCGGSTIIPGKPGRRSRLCSTCRGDA